MNVFSRLQLRATEARLPSQFTASSKEVVQMADSGELLYVAELSFKLRVHLCVKMENKNNVLDNHLTS